MARHLPVVSSVRVGGWVLESLVEQRLPLDAPAEDAFIGLVHGRVRVAVVDPALNDMHAGRADVAARAWGTVLGFLRTEVDPVMALHEANAAIHDPQLGWMGGPMLCLAVMDLDPFQPVAVAGVRAGDAEVFLDQPTLTGTCFTAESLARLAAAREAAGVTAASPDRWRVQHDELDLDDYTCTPLGLAAHARLQTWGPVRVDVAAVFTDGIESPRPADEDALLRVCSLERPGLASSHGDRAQVVARFTGDIR